MLRQLLMIGILLLLSSPGAPQAREVVLDYAVVRTPLRMQSIELPGEKLSAARVVQSVALPGAVIFRGEREVWVRREDGELKPLRSLVDLPQAFNYYTALCPLGKKVAVNVANYTPEQERKDREAPRGAYREGPREAGLLVISFQPLLVEYIPRFTVSPKPHSRDIPGLKNPEGGFYKRPDRIKPNVQDCAWDGKRLITSGYGQLLSLDLKSQTATLLALDIEYPYNRDALFLDGPDIWYSEDHGGIISGCLVRLRKDARKNFCLLNLDNAETVPDTILRHQGRMLTSSLAGVVEIDEKHERYIHYTIGEEPLRMRVYNISLHGGELWGEREDGWVRLDLDGARGELYRMAGAGRSNNVFSLLPLEGGWFVSTDEGVFLVRRPPAGSAPNAAPEGRGP
ncbi:MAG: hypothetical protein OEZ59_05190 [Deltaproteobacteria bacterium]|nr:hypothetical protein [Deltaproteobacteria bacterium]